MSKVVMGFDHGSSCGDLTVLTTMHVQGDHISVLDSQYEPPGELTREELWERQDRMLRKTISRLREHGITIDKDALERARKELMEQGHSIVPL